MTYAWVLAATLIFAATAYLLKAKRSSGHSLAATVVEVANGTGRETGERHITITYRDSQGALKTVTLDVTKERRTFMVGEQIAVIVSNGAVFIKRS